MSQVLCSRCPRMKVNDGFKMCDRCRTAARKSIAVQRAKHKIKYAQQQEKEKAKAIPKEKPKAKPEPKPKTVVTKLIEIIIEDSEDEEEEETFLIKTSDKALKNILKNILNKL